MFKKALFAFVVLGLFATGVQAHGFNRHFVHNEVVVANVVPLAPLTVFSAGPAVSYYGAAPFVDFRGDLVDPFVSSSFYGYSASPFAFDVFAAPPVVVRDRVFFRHNVHFVHGF